MGRPLLGARPASSLYSEANVLTVIRLLASVYFFVLAVTRHSELYNYIGLGIHWLGDSLDGWCARTFSQETLLGAEMDLIADRVETLFFFINFINFRPHLTLPILVYALDFAVVDYYLSYQFVKFDIISVNYFYKVDRRVHRLNFTTPAKVANSSPVPLILIFLPRLWPVTLVFSAVLIGIKIYSISRLLGNDTLRLRPPVAADGRSDPS